MLVNVILLLVGLVVLVVGAEILVRGSASLAKKMKIPPLVIGLTIVAFGTSAPEMTVNVFSAFRGASDIALGNIIGSNIANILLILGIASIINPLKAQRSTVHKELPFSLLAVFVLLVLGNDVRLGNAPINALSFSDGIILISFFSIFLYYIFEMTRKKEKEDGESEEIKLYSTSLSALMIVIGIVFLVVGGKVLVDQAVTLAHLAGVSESLIGLTIVAIGTSFPELATSVVAAFRHQDDIAIGNVVGSNIFNIFWILGLTSVISPIPFNPEIDADLIMTMISTVILFLTFYVGKRHILERGQGFFLVFLYITYIIYLVSRG
ncbi:MAG: calcium/sodium antiporter [Candidatus Paceibacterota bacterium]